MSSMSLAQLVTDALRMLRHEPARLLFQRGAVLWGCSPILSKQTLWVAVSIPGLAVLAARNRTWLHQDPPDFNAFAEQLRPHLRHAEKNETKGFLFQLPLSPFGKCGASVLLCQATTENFPWLEASTFKPVASADVGAFSSTVWRDLLASDPDDIAHLQRGGLLPADDASHDFLRRQAASAGPINLSSEVGRDRLRAFLMRATRRERARLQLMATLVPAGDAIGIPAWVLDPGRDIETFVEGARRQQEDASQPSPTLTAESAPAPTPAPTAALSRSRRPTQHPTVVPSRLPSQSQDVPADEVSGMGPYDSNARG